jgi:hypothetical protein
MVTATHPPKSTKYNQGGLMGHTTKESEKKQGLWERQDGKVLRNTQWEGASGSRGKERKKRKDGQLE